jgi:hypothetical protein
MVETLRYRDACPVGDDCPRVERTRDGWIEVTGYTPGGDHSTDGGPAGVVRVGADAAAAYAAPAEEDR